jgi:general transcription factor 3C polypeptide 3 (transcription factor C subunit 4)
VADFQRGIRGEATDKDGRRRIRGGGTQRRGRGGRRGGSKAAESRPEIKILQTEANEAYVDRNYDKAIALLERLIKTNGEIYGAYTTLGEIHRERGNRQKSLTAFISAAHLKPNDPALWLKCASLALELSETDRAKYLSSAVYMFTNAISADPGDFKSMFERAALYRELGHHGRAATAYEQMLKKLPHDTTVLRHLARVYIDLKQMGKAKKLYKESVTYYSSGGGMLEEEGFSWSDVNIYIELFGHSGEYIEGINELKSLARWMLGRAEETYWDDIRDDDREWDLDDFPRRIKVRGFIPGDFPRTSYGSGLPLELRIRLGLYRLKLDKNQVGEALVRIDYPFTSLSCHLTKPRNTSPGLNRMTTDPTLKSMTILTFFGKLPKLSMKLGFIRRL